MITVREIAPHESNIWDEFVDSEQGSIYFRYGWKEVFARSYNLSSTYLGALQGNTLVGILPLVHLTFGGHRSYVSLPYLYHGGVLSNDAAVTAELYTTARAFADAAHISRLHIREREARELVGFFTDQGNYSFQVPLTASIDETFQSLGHAARKNINKSKNFSFTTRSGLGELKPFYSLYTHQMRELGTPCHSITFWQSIATVFPSNTDVITVYDGDTLVAGMFLMYTPQVMSDILAISLKSYRDSCVYYHLHWEAMMRAITRGISTFDFERSQINTGSFTFKKAWGSEPQQLYYYDTTESSITALKEKYKLVRQLWTYQPLWSSRILGPWLRKSIP